MRVALVHDWLNGMRGGEYVLEAVADLFPESEIFTLFCDPEKISDKIKRHKIVTSFIQNLPLRKSHYRHYLPFFPAAVERFNFDGFDIEISTSHCVAKGAIAGKDRLHICYC
ncbi:MAG: glycosyltransferase family 4 protein, partial [Candidatus Zixiibacteriota bacterium]